jgi:hypothetical protein
VENYFGNAEIGGKTADDQLIRRVAVTVGSQNGFERFKTIVSGWLKRGHAESWGIFVCLAEDTRRMLGGRQ